MTKNKSKQIQQLKYLLLIPVLVSMLFYTSCSKDEVKAKATKQLQTKFLSIKDAVSTKKGDKETYLDLYIGFEKPNWEKITEKDLSANELLEYKEELRAGLDIAKYSDIELYEQENGRKVVAYIHNFKKYFANKPKTIIGKDGSVPFAIVDKVPTFPGCEEGNKDCLAKSIKDFVVKEFNVKLADNLGLKPGKKRVYIQFKIDKSGNVVDIKSRAPHPKLKEEAIRLAKKLPQFKPGVHNGKNVKVGYTLPITFNIQ